MTKFFSAVLAVVLVSGIHTALPQSKPETPVVLEETVERVEGPSIEAALEWAVEIAEDDSHGYSRRNRTGPNYDCSSFVSYALMAGGFEVGGPLGTGGFISVVEKLGFTVFRRSEVGSLCRGDILLRPSSHVELYLGDGRCVAAHQDYDYRSGDSKGKEIQVRDQENCPFCHRQQYTYVIRYLPAKNQRETDDAADPAFVPHMIF